MWNSCCQPHLQQQNSSWWKQSLLAIPPWCLFTGCQLLFVRVNGSSESGWGAQQECCKSHWHLRFRKLTAKYQEDAVVDCMGVLIRGDFNRKYSSCHNSNRQFILLYLHTWQKRWKISTWVYIRPRWIWLNNPGSLRTPPILDGDFQDLILPSEVPPHSSLSIWGSGEGLSAVPTFCRV